MAAVLNNTKVKKEIEEEEKTEAETAAVEANIVEVRRLDAVKD